MEEQNNAMESRSPQPNVALPIPDFNFANLLQGLHILGVLGFVFVAIGTFLPFSQFPYHDSPNWFAGGKGSGMVALIFCVIGIICFLLRNVAIPLTISVTMGFLFILDLLTSYDLVGIHNGTAVDPAGPFRLIVHIFRDAFKVGNGASFIATGFFLVFCASLLSFICDEGPAHDAQKPA